MTYAQRYGLQSADRVVETITQFGMSKHHVIYLYTDASGIEWMAENVKGHGVKLMTAQQHFGNAKAVCRIEKFVGTLDERRAAVQRALQQVGRPYDLIKFNCEHFAEQVQTGKPRSRQVEHVALGLAALCIIGLLTAE
jgi:uncharacterized protein YycO